MVIKKQYIEMQTKHIQETLVEMFKDNTVAEMLTYLESEEVHATKDMVYHYRRKHSIPSRVHPKVEAKNTFYERIGQYVAAIRQFNGNQFSNKTLGMHGAIWARCATKLHDAGLIQQVDIRPCRYVQVCSDGDMLEWYNEVNNATQCSRI